LGNEVTGVDTEIMPLLDLVIEIPMFGSKNSLNIAACAPVVLYEILRQWECDELSTIESK
jgi:tRNA G18 (ribose-2'-O)-methylase SpoU